MPKKLDLTGQKFGRLTVIEEVGRSKQKAVKWRCKCECGNETIVTSINLRSGDTKSCGCLRKETKFKVGQKFGRLTIIERATNDKHGQTTWRCKCECGNETNAVAAYLKSGDKRSCGCLSKEMSSKRARENELNKKGIEYRKENNLKEGTDLGALDKRMNKNNTSGVKGVWWHKNNEKWIAELWFRRKKHHLGSFSNKQDAINARKKAEEELFEPILEKYGKKKTD